jgi:hypothetical protein
MFIDGTEFLKSFFIDRCDDYLSFLNPPGPKLLTGDIRYIDNCDSDPSTQPAAFR